MRVLGTCTAVISYKLYHMREDTKRVNLSDLQWNWPDDFCPHDVWPTDEDVIHDAGRETAKQLLEVLVPRDPDDTEESAGAEDTPDPDLLSFRHRDALMVEYENSWGLQRHLLSVERYQQRKSISNSPAGSSKNTSKGNKFSLFSKTSLPTSVSQNTAATAPAGPGRGIWHDLYNSILSLGLGNSSEADGRARVEEDTSKLTASVEAGAAPEGKGKGKEHAD